MYELIKGDYKEKIKNIDSNSIDLVVTDPPYWHKKSPGRPYSERNQSKTNSKFANSKMFNADSMMMKKMSDFTGKDVFILMPEIERVMKKMNAYLFCNDTLLPYYGMWAENNNYHFSVLIWEKPLSIINKNRFSQHVEYIVRIYEYGTGLNKIQDKSKLYSKVKKYSQVKKNEKIHLTQKPVELIKELIEVSSNVGDTVLDLFSGSFTTCIACLVLNRKFKGIEKDSIIFDKGEKRVNEYKATITQTKSKQDTEKLFVNAKQFENKQATLDLFGVTK